MKINNLHLTHLHNELHFQYHAEFKQLVEEGNPKTLKIEKEFSDYLLIYQKEDDTLKVIRKSAVTENIADADSQRDITFRGITNAVKTALQHFKPEVKEAAQKVKIVLDTYGNVPQKPYDEESASITNILQELKGKYAIDIATIGITDWVNLLETNNNHFLDLVKERYNTLNLNTVSTMVQVRKEVDEQYHIIADRINALIIIEGSTIYQTFVDALNQRIVHYRNMLLHREGVLHKKKDEDNRVKDNEK